MYRKRTFIILVSAFSTLVFAEGFAAEVVAQSQSRTKQQQELNHDSSNWEKSPRWNIEKGEVGNKSQRKLKIVAKPPRIPGTDSTPKSTSERTAPTQIVQTEPQPLPQSLPQTSRPMTPAETSPAVELTTEPSLEFLETEPVLEPRERDQVTQGRIEETQRQRQTQVAEVPEVELPSLPQELEPMVPPQLEEPQIVATPPGVQEHNRDGEFEPIVPPQMEEPQIVATPPVVQEHNRGGEVEPTVPPQTEIDVLIEDEPQSIAGKHLPDSGKLELPNLPSVPEFNLPSIEFPNSLKVWNWRSEESSEATENETESIAAGQLNQPSTTEEPGLLAPTDVEVEEANSGSETPTAVSQKSQRFNWQLYSPMLLLLIPGWLAGKRYIERKKRKRLKKRTLRSNRTLVQEEQEKAKYRRKLVLGERKPLHQDANTEQTDEFANNDVQTDKETKSDTDFGLSNTIDGADEVMEGLNKKLASGEINSETGTISDIQLSDLTSVETEPATDFESLEESERQLEEPEAESLGTQAFDMVPDSHGTQAFDTASEFPQVEEAGSDTMDFKAAVAGLAKEVDEKEETAAEYDNQEQRTEHAEFDEASSTLSQPVPDVGAATEVLNGDDFSCIAGIDSEIQATLNQAGICYFSDLVNADPKRLQQILDDGDFNGRVWNCEDWQVQAGFAKARDWDGLKGHLENLQQISINETVSIEESKKTDTVVPGGELQKSDTKVPGIEAPVNDVTNTIQLNEIDERDEERAEEVAVERPADADDLTVITGVNSDVANFLARKGVFYFEQIAESDRQKLKELFADAGDEFANVETSVWPYHAAAAIIEKKAQGGERPNTMSMTSNFDIEPVKKDDSKESDILRSVKDMITDGKVEDETSADSDENKSGLEDPTRTSLLDMISMNPDSDANSESEEESNESDILRSVRDLITDGKVEDEASANSDEKSSDFEDPTRTTFL